jgi:large subunit ribosomal protein L5
MATMPRMKQIYQDKATPNLVEKFEYKNVMSVPTLKKVVINMGIGRAMDNPKLLESAVSEIEVITGQKAVKTFARKSISNFKLREGAAIGAKVTLRGERMWEFLDRLINFALPRVRDFRGVSTRLSGSGDYTLGLKDQLIFPEINFDNVDEHRGMNITIVTSAKTDEEGFELLSQLGMPYRRS